MTDLVMKDYESGFLMLILAGILVMVIGLGLMMSAARSPDDLSLVVRRTVEPSPAFTARPINASGPVPAAPVATDRKG